MTPALFEPLKIGDITIQHRIALAPLTRTRANDRHVHQAVAVEYYSQRANTPKTLLISEATLISPQAGGWAHVPGIYNDDQVKAWKAIVDAVHAKGSYMFLQLWALGRAADYDVLKKEPEGSFEVVGASDVPMEGGATPRPLTEAEIDQYVKDYALAAKRFIEEAGGDGVEIHGGNGYIVDQFLQTNSNNRTDQYGGSIENRIRFPLAVVKAVSEAVGQKKTAMRMSPWSYFQSMRMPDGEQVKSDFATYVKALKSNFPDLAYIHVVEPRVSGATDVSHSDFEETDFLYKLWTPKPFLSAGGYTGSRALEAAEERSNLVTVFGRYFSSNPDLVERVMKGVELEPYDRSTLYSPGPEKVEGYTTYPIVHKYEKA